MCELGTHAKFRNPTTTPPGISITAERTTRKIITKNSGRMHFARTKIKKLGKQKYKREGLGNLPLCNFDLVFGKGVGGQFV